MVLSSHSRRSSVVSKLSNPPTSYLSLLLWHDLPRVHSYASNAWRHIGDVETFNSAPPSKLRLPKLTVALMCSAESVDIQPSSTRIEVCFDFHLVEPVRPLRGSHRVLLMAHLSKTGDSHAPRLISAIVI